MKVDPIPMTRVLMRREKRRPSAMEWRWEECTYKPKDVKNCQEPAKVEEARRNSSPKPSEGVWPSQHLVSDF